MDVMDMLLNLENCMHITNKTFFLTQNINKSLLQRYTLLKKASLVTKIVISFMSK